MKRLGIQSKLLLMMLVVVLAVSGCKQNDNPAHDAINNEPGSFNENHPQGPDTSATVHDTVTSNSTQTDPNAS